MRSSMFCKLQTNNDTMVLWHPIAVCLCNGLTGSEFFVIIFLARPQVGTKVREKFSALILQGTIAQVTAALNAVAGSVEQHTSGQERTSFISRCA